MVNSKHVPKGLTSRFKAKQLGLKLHRLQSYRQSQDQKRLLTQYNSSEQIFSLSEIPFLPIPSDDLKSLLLEFNNINVPVSLGNETITKRANRRASRHLKNMKIKKINGFIAFRSFYSRLITNPDHQRQLSVLLGKLWVNEPNRATWNRYAIEYNALLGNSRGQYKPFVEWLCDTLHLNGEEKVEETYTNVVSNITWEFSSRCQDNKVEDVYFTW
ncbi:uncharacterized protein PRCAT00005999001 [Priceomyces carsonii]|uniref:uncharacterized protein n=1 Tax=Priceomyces carsonii TaxID=28549 RepID=UPI002ED7D189|nr:unnamed protein product [Priceomyces carsonii]